MADSLLDKINAATLALSESLAEDIFRSSPLLDAIGVMSSPLGRFLTCLVPKWQALTILRLYKDKVSPARISEIVDEMQKARGYEVYRKEEMTRLIHKDFVTSHMPRDLAVDENDGVAPSWDGNKYPSYGGGTKIQEPFTYPKRDEKK